MEKPFASPVAVARYQKLEEIREIVEAKYWEAKWRPEVKCLGEEAYGQVVTRKVAHRAVGDLRATTPDQPLLATASPMRPLRLLPRPRIEAVEADARPLVAWFAW